MTPIATDSSSGVAGRARLSLGISNDGIYEMVRRMLRRRGISGGTLLDVGCGTGNLGRLVGDLFDTYLAADVVRYEEFFGSHSFHEIDVDTGRIPLPDETADVVAAVETIEHVENPRAFMRELIRLTKPGGWVIVTTPNQLSLLNLLALLVKHRHVQFQDVHYPAHLTALLEIDLIRMASEVGLVEIETTFSESGRVPLTGWQYPRWASRLAPRALSDNVLLISRKAARGDVAQRTRGRGAGDS